MVKRLLICGTCELKRYYTRQEVQQIVVINCELCPECGDNNYHDHGWVETES